MDPFFRSHLDLAHQYWEKILQETDWAIDATCGNGKDTLKLAKILKKGTVIAIDIQEEALRRTRILLESHLSKEAFSRVHLYHQSHVDFPSLATQQPIRLIVYNLGYLPKGDKQLTTTTQTTLESVRKALDLIMPGGALFITCYPGHREGQKEEKALLKELSRLPSSTWKVCHQVLINHPTSPSLLLVQKK